MEELMYVKQTDGLSHEAAHAYEHAFMMTVVARGRQAGFVPYLAFDVNGTTVHTTFMYLLIDMLTSEATSMVKSLFVENPQPSSPLLDEALRQIAAEDLATIRVKDRARFENELHAMTARPWVPIRELPLLREAADVPSPLTFVTAKDHYRYATVTVHFGEVTPMEAAVLSRLVYQLTTGISFEVPRAFTAYSKDSGMLHYEDGRAMVEQKLIVKAATTKAQIRQAVQAVLDEMADPRQAHYYREHFISWTAGATTQYASRRYFDTTGQIIGTAVLLEELPAVEVSRLFRDAAIRVSLRKA